MHLSDAARRSSRVVLALATSALLALLVIPGSADAASGDLGTVNATDFRSCSDLRCPSSTQIPQGTRVPVSCWRDGGDAFRTARWFRVRYRNSDGWVSANKVASPQPAVPYCNDLKPDEGVFAGQSLWSTNGRYRFIMQTDGNLVLYGPGGAIWASRTTGSGGDRVYMQRDGNLVVYAGYNPVWATGTAFSGSNLVNQDDGNTVMYGAGRALWASGWHATIGQSRGANWGESGNCTWYANERFKGFTGYYPAFQGDASNWNDSGNATGWLVRDEPSTQAIVVFEGYISSSSAGHVAWVDAMRPSGNGIEIHVWEMNVRGLGVVSDRWVTHRAGMSYVLAPTK